MKRYDLILFDADDTLLDFKQSEQAALRETFASFHLPFASEHLALYRQINHTLWKQFEQGLTTKEALTTARFEQLFQQLKTQVDAKGFNDKYITQLAMHGFCMPGAKQMCQALAGKVEMAVVTNGICKVQQQRLRQSGLSGYFSHVFVSEQAGAQKPRKEFFDYVFNAMPDVCKERTLVVGDSLTSDIQGANNAGLDACWYNPKGQTNAVHASFVMQISELTELPYHIIL